MGYYTTFNLSIQVLEDVINTKEQEILEIQKSNLNQDIKNHLVSLINEKYGRQEITEQTVVAELNNFNPFNGDRYKWYEFDEDMLRISKKFPHAVFTLDGDGEETGDVWRKYYCNGKVQDAKAKMVYEPFDFNKLS